MCAAHDARRPETVSEFLDCVVKKSGDVEPRAVGGGSVADSVKAY